MHDPVCGMDVTAFPGAITDRRYEGRRFCGEHCLRRFHADSARFLKTPLIALRGVRKSFRRGDLETPVLRGMDLNIWQGDFVAIIGASGSGKSTVLNMIGLLDRPTEGSYALRGLEVSTLSEEDRAGTRSKTFGFVFQQYNLLPWLTAYENVALPAVFAGKRAEDARIKADFASIGMGGRTHHRPPELSGGEQQRTALLRALSNDPDVILGDEPTGNLDSETGRKILELLIGLNKRRGKTLVVVTHDAGIAGMADQIVTVKDGRMVGNHETHKKLYTD